MTIGLAQPQQLPRANVRPTDDPFPADSFLTIYNVPVFAEHQTKARDGRVLRFSRDELQAVAQRCNQRIAETGDYAAISVGHTSDPGQPHTEPEVIGAAGPFRLGLLGEPGQRQRYCILADFHVRRDRLDRYNANPRRSPELWLEDSYDEMFLDPISLLGAEAPRLDMGLAPLVNAKGSDGSLSHLYSAKRNGRVCEKYAAASPGDCNVYVPSTGNEERKPKHYAAEPANQQERKALMLQPEDIRQIVDAIEALDWVAEVKDLITRERAEHEALETAPPEGGAPGLPGAPEGPMDDAPIAPGAALPDAQAGTQAPPLPETPPEAPAAEPEKEKDALIATPAAQQAAPGYKPSGGLPHEGSTASMTSHRNASPPNPKKPYSAEGSAPKGTTEMVGGKLEDLSEEDIEKYLCERRKRKYAAEGSAGPDAKVPPAGEVEGSPAKKPAEGSIAGESQVAPTAKYSALEARLAELEGDRIASKEDARKAKLHQLRYHRAFDLDKEVERCRYAKMNDEQFGEHCQVIADNYVPTMANAPMPAPQELKMPEPVMRTKPERYTKEAAEQAIKVCTELKGQGKTVSYETILENIVNGRPAEWTAGQTT